jgi:uncharacterized protein YaaR (DUF327 family)
MAWLTGKKRAEEKAARLQTEREEASRRNEQKAAVIDGTSKKDLLKRITHELNLIDRLPRGVAYISDSILGLSSAFETIDPSRLTTINKARLYDVIYAKLPKACSTYKTYYLNGQDAVYISDQAYNANIPDYGCSVKSLFQSMMKTMEEVRISQDELQPVQQQTLPQAPQQEHQFSSELHDTVKSLLGDDDFSKQFYRLDKLIKRVNSNGSNTVEDSHFLEQVVKEYIPGAISLYALFLDADDARKSKARDNLKEQFDLIEDKLMDMASKVLDRDLAQFETKTSFLRTKIEDEKLAAVPARRALNA